jgi:pimeloyl-ACP methyl ester carboxylesterase
MADNAAAPRGVLVWLVGGPGEPGVGLTAVIARQFDPAVLRDYRLVLFSPRGTGAGALRCPQLQQVMNEVELTVPSASVVHACARSIGDQRRFYTTADTVADLDALRQALRVGTLTLDGASYGTFVAERYAITHPDRVSRLVLDSAVPHDSFDPLEIAAFNRTADVLRMVCAETRCATDPAQDLAQVIRARHDGPQLLDTLSSLTLGAPRLSGIPAALHEAARGETTALDAIVAIEARKRAAPVELFSHGLHASTVCADFRWPWGDAEAPVPGRASALAQAVAALPDAAVFPYDRVTAASNETAATCAQWPPTPVVSFPSGADLPPVPTLLLAGDHDLITPLAWTQHEATHATHAHLVVVPGSGHITQNTGNGPAGRAAVTAFLTGP